MRWNLRLLFTLFSLCALVLPLKAQEISLKEKEALLDLYASAGGEQWTNAWDLNAPVSQWHGVDLMNGHVIRLNLFNNQVSGTLPSSIGKLKKLEYLNLSFNQLTGALPKQITQLKNLRVLKLEMNRLKGELPAKIGEMQ